ncbi:integrase family protein [Neobacillus bataviensis LMG 21833]|uniref:Integrase family protein n=1 Tax=Neobacillus bataviensis LMG 21833 TaxID=1117379 RepID=K6DDL9_9BACI|nr:hypothetical protein [Neobacillus bataviensis]EKN66148.1 integrase family protein [Neobacillus bataviensis LMG 21833]
MNVQNLRDNYPKLISYMETNGYSKHTLIGSNGEVEKIFAVVDSKECLYTRKNFQDPRTSKKHIYCI